MASAMAHTWTVVAEGGGPATPDLAEARRALVVLVDPDARHELRGLPSGRSRLVRGDDPDGALRAVEALCDDRLGVYYSLNPVRPDLGDRSAKNADILARRWLLVDVDRAKGDRPDDSSTGLEKAAAGAVADAVQAALAARGWPEPVVIDTGNAWHLLYRVDLPNDDLARQWCARALKALAAAHDAAGVTIDRKVHNASRIAKLPGTWARKGPDSPERPHRMCRLWSVPTTIEPVSAELIRDLAGLATGDPAPPSGPGYPRLAPWGTRATDRDGDAYARSALERETGKVATAGAHRNDQLYESALKLGGFVGAGHLDRGEVAAQLTLAAERCGLGADGDPGEIRRAIDNGLAVGVETPRAIPERAGGKGKKPQPTPLPEDPEASIIVQASRITPRKVEWLWPGRIPRGMLTTFAGWGGLGKTFVLLDIAARVSRGDEWPDSGGECAEPGRILFVSGEDDPDITLVPRLIELGADLDRIFFLCDPALDRFTLADLPLLDRAIDQVGPEANYVAIDPPTAFLDGVDDHRNGELRGLLMPLKAWAKRRNVALVFNTHVNKSSGPNVEAMGRVMGSVAWVNAVRAAYMMAPDPDDKGRRLFVGLKINVGKMPKGLAYRIAPTEALARVEWLGEVDTTADEAVGRDKKKPRSVSATEWLVERFREKREWPSTEFWNSAKEHSISKEAINQVRDKLSIPKPRKITTADGDIHWTWHVPPDWIHLTGPVVPGG